MACAFLDKLPSELRKQVYEYILDFDIPLRHATQLQPFVKRLTGVDGELPFDYEDQQVGNSSLAWIPMEEADVANTDILSTNKLIYNEATKVFYDLNVISVDIELFKLAITSPTATDLSLAKRLVITFNPSHDEEVQNLRFFNTINMEIVRPPKPPTSLFDIAHDCLKTRFFCQLTFEGVGDCVATAWNGLTLCIKYQRLTDLQQEMIAMSAANVSIAMRRLNNPVHTFDDQVFMAALSRGILEQALEKHEALAAGLLADHRKRTAVAPCMFSKLEVNSVAFWTEIACPHEGYLKDDESEEGHDGDDGDGSDGSDDIVRVDNSNLMRNLV